MNAPSALRVKSAHRRAPRTPARSTQSIVQEALRLVWLAQRASSAQMAMLIQCPAVRDTFRRQDRELAQSAQQAHTVSQLSVQMVMLSNVDLAHTRRLEPPDAKSAPLVKHVQAMVAKTAL